MFKYDREINNYYNILLDNSNKISYIHLIFNIFFLHCYFVRKYISLENDVLFYVTYMGHVGKSKHQ